jgi:uncharacterized metal-binding protein YceD (DUF177 family)
MPVEPSVPNGDAARIAAGTPTVDPFEMADRGARFLCQLEPAAFVRLNELVNAVDDVDVELTFSRDHDGHCRVDGQASFAAQVECHWCLEPVAVAIAADIGICVAGSDTEANELGGAFDTHVLDDGTTTSIVTLIEDDLILALPSRACTEEDCPRRPEVTFPADDAETKDQAKPFEVLAALKSSGQTRSD